MHIYSKKSVVSCFDSLMHWWLEKGFDCSQGTGCPSVEIRLMRSLQLPVRHYAQGGVKFAGCDIRLVK